MTKTDRQKLHKAFTKCLPYISKKPMSAKELNTCTFICSALHHALMYDQIDHRTMALAKALISNRLQGCVTLESWLLEKHNFSIVDTEGSRRRMQAHRIAWVKLLIKEFKD